MKIPIKRYVDDPSLSWEERYARLSAHHVEETAWLVSRAEALQKELEECRAERDNLDARHRCHQAGLEEAVQLAKQEMEDCFCKGQEQPCEVCLAWARLSGTLEGQAIHSLKSAPVPGGEG